MTLPEIYSLLSKIKDGLYLSSTATTLSNTPENSTYKIENIRQVRYLLNLLNETGLFQDNIEELKKTSLYRTPYDEEVIGGKEFNNIKLNFDIIKLGVQGVLLLLNKILNKSEHDTIRIKLPDTEDLKEISKYLNEFEKILSLTILHEDIGGQIKVVNIYQGSVWIEIYVGSALAVPLIGGIVWAAAVINKKINEGKIIKQYSEGLKIKNESMRDLMEAQKQFIEMTLDFEANHLYLENYRAKDPEQLGRLKHSIQLMQELIQKGAEVHPALSAPESIQNLFPKQQELPLIESKIKRLEQ
ncbi:hypothetical protein GXP67_25425 [Rhodocytophaga rosea]|uniref:Uncharacterized protein n=1 Tax=Rhodocytophaga rosea TaxID=2704465 RepID=A0A6C0GNY8_9BACT|nr:hypothetical protein [Rhodocytophaga rosea]QHT69749.1 hypothetical protein GXP67_25425 [Rhodocytophaga rosea]